MLLKTVHGRKWSIISHKLITVRVQTWQAMRLCQNTKHSTIISHDLLDVDTAAVNKRQFPLVPNDEHFDRDRK